MKFSLFVSIDEFGTKVLYLQLLIKTQYYGYHINVLWYNHFDVLFG